MLDHFWARQTEYRMSRRKDRERKASSFVFGSYRCFSFQHWTASRSCSSARDSEVAGCCCLHLNRVSDFQLTVLTDWFSLKRIRSSHKKWRGNVGTGMLKMSLSLRSPRNLSSSGANFEKRIRWMQTCFRKLLTKTLSEPFTDLKTHLHSFFWLFWFVWNWTLYGVIDNIRVGLEFISGSSRATKS